MNDRREWLRKAGIIIAGVGLSPAALVAAPRAAKGSSEHLTDDKPIRLCYNENPYGASPQAQDAMADAICVSHRYQWDNINKLMGAIARRNDLAAANVVVGAGSTELIDLVVQYAGHRRGDLILAAPTFNRWTNAAEICGLHKVEVPLNRSKEHDLDTMYRKMNTNTRLVYICNPNNPTGTICEHEELVSFVRKACRKALVLVDEAYIEYSGERSLSYLVNELENLLVVRTFSKIFGMAGARAGYLLGNERTIQKISSLRSGVNTGISATAVAGAIASLRDEEHLRLSYQRNTRTREYTVNGLRDMGLYCISSHTNFIYISLGNYRKDFFAQLKDHNILGTGIFEETGKWTRISVGTHAEMARFLDAIE